MNNENYIRRTLRIPETIYNKINIISEENNLSVNQLINEILKYNTDNYEKLRNEKDNKILDFMEQVNSKIDILDRKINWQTDISKQIFLNSGFRINRSEKEDEIYQEFKNSKYKR